MNEAYKKYIIDKWFEAEDIAKEIGCGDNKVITSIFDKIAQPFYYWSKNENK